MRESEAIDKLAGALCKAQAAMGGAVKGADNPFFKTKYADLGSVVKALKVPFSENGLSYVQFPFSSDGGIGVTTRLMHTSGQWLESEFTLPMKKADPQQAGSAITYARRYALQSIAGIPTADDDGEAAMLQARKTLDDWKHELSKSIVAVKEGIASGDLSAAAEAWFELDKEEMQAIWVAPSSGGPFTTQEREIMKSSAFKEAHFGEAA